MTLVAKSVQTLANFTKFGAKEPFLEFMNAFIDNESGRMREFIRKISVNNRKFDFYFAILVYFSHFRVHWFQNQSELLDMERMWIQESNWRFWSDVLKIASN